MSHRRRPEAGECAGERTAGDRPAAGGLPTRVTRRTYLAGIAGAIATGAGTAGAVEDCETSASGDYTRIDVGTDRMGIRVGAGETFPDDVIDGSPSGVIIDSAPLSGTCWPKLVTFAGLPEPTCTIGRSPEGGLSKNWLAPPSYLKYPNAGVATTVERVISAAIRVRRCAGRLSLASSLV